MGRSFLTPTFFVSHVLCFLLQLNNSCSNTDIDFNHRRFSPVLVASDRPALDRHINKPNENRRVNCFNYFSDARNESWNSPKMCFVFRTFFSASLFDRLSRWLKWHKPVGYTMILDLRESIAGNKRDFEKFSCDFIGKPFPGSNNAIEHFAMFPAKHQELLFSFVIIIATEIELNKWENSHIINMKTFLCAIKLLMEVENISPPRF